MKYLIAIVATAFVIWGVMAFVTMLPNPADWPEINRALCVIITLWLSAAICFVMASLGIDE